MKCKIYLQKCFALLTVLMLTSVVSVAQSLTVTGTVTDAAGQPLVGVSVTVQGTTVGVSTDATGKYSIKVPSAQSVLNFNYLGYVDQTKTVGAQKVIDIALVEDAQTLDEVVVIGYGTVKRRDLTGSVASVGGSDIQAMPVANAAQALQGRIAGVTITTTDGRPDAGVKVRVRGGGSITQSNDPLYIVDGFPVKDISDIPSSQIESIDILKDASSTAIYGARGANGVVIVTTKSPKGDKLSISYDGFVQWKTKTDVVDMLDPYDFTLLNWEYAASNGTQTRESFEQAMAIGSKFSKPFTNGSGTFNNPEGLNAYKSAQGYNWMDQLMNKSAFSHSHNLNISGGNEKTKFNIGYNYINDEGLKIQSWYKRTNVSAKLQQVLAKGVLLDADVRYSRSSVLGKFDDSRLSDILKYSPVAPLGDYNENTNNGLGVNAMNIKWNRNPIDIVNDVYNRNDMNSVRGNLALSWEIIKGLTFRTEFGASQMWRENSSFTGSIAKNTPTKGGDATVKNTTSTRYRFANTLNYQVQGLNDQHSLTILVGQEITGNNSSDKTISGKDFPITYDFSRALAMLAQYNKATTTTPTENSIDDPERMASFFGRVNYSFKDRYLLAATFRADGSSNFAPSNRWGYFPAASAAWRISEEPFMKGASNWLDNLKLRLSYGEAGNDRISSGLWRAQWIVSTGGYGSNNQAQNYYEPATSMLINPELKWETTVTRNVGIDFGFFNNRLYGTIDGYWNTTKDLLLVNSLPPFAGFDSQMDNVGKTRNLGIEFSLGGDIVRNKDWRVSANFNIGFNKNKVEELSDGMSYKTYSSGIGTSSASPKDDFIFRVGSPVGLIRGYVSDGFYTASDFEYNSKGVITLKNGVANSLPVLGTVNMGGAYPGMMKLKKMGTKNNQTEINEADDCVVIGNTNPKHTGGFNLNASWKNFDAMLAFNWSYGNDVYNYTRALLSTGGKDYNRNFLGTFKDRYKVFDINSQGQIEKITDLAKLDAMNTNASTYYPFHEFRVLTDEFVEDGSFLRLNNVTVGYTLPVKWTQKVAISKLRIYATVYNAWLWTNYTGMDPEVDAGSGRNSTYPTPGMDYGTYPRARTYTFGINLTF